MIRWRRVERFVGDGGCRLGLDGGGIFVCFAYAVC